MRLSDDQFSQLMKLSSRSRAAGGVVDALYRQRTGGPEDRRAAPREPLGAPAVLQLAGPDGSVGPPLPARLRDASLTGVGFSSPLSLREGTRMVMHVQRGRHGRLSLWCVARNCRPADAQHFRVGAEFDEPPAGAQGRGRAVSRVAFTLASALFAAAVIAAVMWVRSH